MNETNGVWLPFFLFCLTSSESRHPISSTLWLVDYAVYRIVDHALPNCDKFLIRIMEFQCELSSLFVVKVSVNKSRPKFRRRFKTQAAFKPCTTRSFWRDDPTIRHYWLRPTIKICSLSLSGLSWEPGQRWSRSRWWEMGWVLYFRLGQRIRSYPGSSWKMNDGSWWNDYAVILIRHFLRRCVQFENIFIYHQLIIYIHRAWYLRFNKATL